MTVMADEDLWNSINLIAPSFSTYYVDRKSFEIKNFKKLLESAIKYFSDQTAFYDEVNHISQFIHIGKRQFRMMKGFQEMKKTHQAATRLKRLDIFNVLETFNSYVADDFQSEILLPHRQNLDYLLIKLQGLSKVLIRIVTCSRKSARYFLGVIKNGSFYLRGSVLVSSLAKIWNLSRQMCQYTVILYNNLGGFRDKLKKLDTTEWISNDYYIPEKLDEWLGDDYQFYVINETYESKLLTKLEDIESFRNNITQVTEIFEKFRAEEKEVVINVHSNEDQEVISQNNEMELEDFKPIARNQIAQNKEEYEHSLALIKSKEGIKQFIKIEDKYRKVDAEKSLTKRIKQKNWKHIKNDLKNKLTLMHENSLVEYFHDNLNHFLSVE